MPILMKLLEKRVDQIDDQLAETLLSFNDFMLFKQLMLEYKPQAKAGVMDLQISGIKASLHQEEQSDGEEMPDLNLDIKPYKAK